MDDSIPNETVTAVKPKFQSVNVPRISRGAKRRSKMVEMSRVLSTCYSAARPESWCVGSSAGGIE